MSMADSPPTAPAPARCLPRRPCPGPECAAARPGSRADAGSHRRQGEDLFARYAGRLRALVAANLRGPVVSRISPDDIVQSALRAFFERRPGLAHAAPDAGELWGLLCVLAMNKLRERVAYHHAARRDVRRTAGGVDALPEPAPEPGLDFEVDDLLGQLRPADREVVRLRMAGYEVAEIAARTQRSLRTVERVLQSVRAKLSTQPA
jgi:DNA-directed RNA polymerase specialized sigma24 family protein